MKTLIFATNNKNKVEEIRHIIPKTLSIITLEEAGIFIDIPEPHPTIEENAIEKVTYIHHITNQNCFAEDTGLEVESLNGEPGVLSARYAGEEKSPEKNIEKLLLNLAHLNNKKARFKTVISIIYNENLHCFEGICEGTITAENKGDKGFGYDPIFIPDGSNKTFAQMTLDEKASFSHRRKATDKLVEFLKTV